MSSSSRLIFTVWCSAAIWAAFVLAKDSENSSSEEGYSGEKHGHDCGKHHHDHGDGGHRHHHHHHHHPRFHHSRHHHHHHHHGPNKNVTSTTLSNNDITTTLSPVYGNDLDPQIGNADVGIAFSSTTTAPLSTDLGIVEHQPDNGGIDLRGSKAVEQTDNNLTTIGENTESLDAFLENLGNDQILTTSSSTPSGTTNELTSDSTNPPTAASEQDSELLN